MKLLIVESPAKARKIKTFLGEDYAVEATMGHIREIPERVLGVDIENGFTPTFVVREDKREVVEKLKRLAETADEILIASDPDREGEAISRHVFDVLPVHSQVKCKRVVYHEITKKAILAAITKPREIDQNLVAAAYARQVLDRLIGYRVSPILWASVARGTSAGRVQSVALKLVCERQREIDAFTAVVFWYIDVLLKSKGGDFWARVVVPTDKNNRFTDKTLSTAALKKLKESKYVLSDVQKASRSVSPKPPFDTNSMQSSASAVMKWDITKSMKVAQSLYEKGKCFLPGTLIADGSGDIVAIENLVLKGVVTLPSVGMADYAETKAKCSPVILQHNGSVVDITLDGGVQLSVTPEHVFPVFDSDTGLITDKRVKDINVKSDFLLKPKAKKQKLREKINILELFEGVDPILISRTGIHFSKGFVRTIPNIKEVVCRTFAWPTYYKYRRNDWLPLFVVFELINRKFVSRKDIKDNYLGMSDLSKMKPIPFELPPSLFYISGLVASDGHLPRGEKKIMLGVLLQKSPRKKNIEEYVDVVKVINSVVTPFGAHYNKKLNFYCTSLFQLIRGIGVPEGKKSKIIDFPSCALVDDDYTTAFLAGLWDGDGYFTEVNGKNGLVSAIQAGYTSSSLTMIKKVKIVLERFGIHTYTCCDKRSGVNTLKVSLKDVPDLYRLLRPFSKIKTSVYEKIGFNRLTPYLGRNPSNMPIAALILSEIERSGVSKNKLTLASGMDVWRYIRKNSGHTRKGWVPNSVALKYAKILKSDAIRKLLNFEFCRIARKTERCYCGPVYCYQSDNSYFLVEDGIWTHNCTYIRTDSFNISDEAMDEVRQHITAEFGQPYLSKKPNTYAKKSTSGSQEAHECIRPTHMSDTGADLAGDDAKLYKLVRDRFLACQMAPMVIDTVKFVIDADCGEKLVAAGQTLAFDGFSKVWSHKSQKEDDDGNGDNLPPATKGEALEFQEAKQTENKTKPPARYTDASLASKMEADGVGRPATRAPIIKSMEDKGYLTKDKTALVPTPVGLSIVDFLAPSFGESFMDIKFTAGMEEEMAKIADGKSTFLGVVSAFWSALKTNIEKFGSVSKDPVNTGVKCPVCHDGDIVERQGKFGKFLSCNKYPECKTVVEKMSDGTFGLKAKKSFDETGESCYICKKGNIVLRHGSYGDFYACDNYPSCKATFIFDGEKFVSKQKLQPK